RALHDALPIWTLPSGSSLGVFLDSARRSLASFAGRVSSGTDTAAVAFGDDAEPALPPAPLKAGYAAPNTVRPPRTPVSSCRFFPSRKKAREQGCDWRVRSSHALGSPRDRKS